MHGIQVYPRNTKPFKFICISFGIVESNEYTHVAIYVLKVYVARH